MTPDNDRIALKQAVRELVDSDALDPRELQRLRRLASGAPEQPRRRRWLAAAATVAGSAALGYLASTLLGEGDRLQAMAEEIAGNHLRAAPLDIESSELPVLRAHFAALGFGLLDAAAIEGVPGQLLGGRACSVASVPAAMLRYLSEHGIATVYQARYDPEHHHGAAAMDQGEKGRIRHARGVQVCLCHTQGVLLAVAIDAGVAERVG
jgi:anti-sigma factor RsiW